MDLQDLSEKKSSTNNNSKINLPNKKIIYIAAALAALVIIVGGFTAYQNVQETNRKIDSIIEGLNKCAELRTENRVYYPLQPNNSYAWHSYVWEDGGYFDQLRDNPKLTNALVTAMEADCTTTDKETGEATFRYSGVTNAYAMAAVLEYMDYENPEVKACLDSLTAQALAVANESKNFSTTRIIYNNLLPFKGLTYYTGITEQMPNEQVEDVYLARWQTVKQEMSGGDADLGDFIDDVAEIAGKSPTTVPKRILSTEADKPVGTATAANGVTISQTELDVNKMAPQAEIMAALQEYGETAIFRNGQGGYYDFSREKGTKYGDFLRVVVSGRVSRTGQEDAFTENYLREHYDKPDSTYYYFKGSRINALPSLFSDTTNVFVYDNEVFAFTDYAVYYRSECLPYDYEKAKEMEFKHVSLNEEEYLRNIIEQEVRPYLQKMREFSPRYDYDVENSLVTVYLTALPGTTAALQAGESIPFSAQDDSKLEWSKFCDYLSNLSKQMESAVNDFSMTQIGVGIIVISDVNPDGGLLSLLNGEVAQDNSGNPPEPVSPEPANPEEE